MKKKAKLFVVKQMTTCELGLSSIQMEECSGAQFKAQLKGYL